MADDKDDTTQQVPEAKDADAGAPDTGQDPTEPVAWEAPSAALVPMGEQPDTDAAAALGGGSATGWKVATIVSLVVIALLIAATALLWNKVSDVEDDVNANKGATTDAVEPVQQSVDDLKDQVSELQSSIDDLSDSQVTENDLDAITNRLDGVVSCVNTYMDVIARWTNNIESTFSYDHCV
jgi:uncharacterized protein YoxC